jgi:hypothetical protein
VQRASVVLPDDKSRRRGAYTRRSDSWAWKRNQSKNMYMRYEMCDIKLPTAGPGNAIRARICT